MEKTTHQMGKSSRSARVAMDMMRLMSLNQTIALVGPESTRIYKLVEITPHKVNGLDPEEVFYDECSESVMDEAWNELVTEPIKGDL